MTVKLTRSLAFHPLLVNAISFIESSGDLRTASGIVHCPTALIWRDPTGIDRSLVTLTRRQRSVSQPD